MPELLGSCSFQLPVPPSANRWWRMFPAGGKRGNRSIMVLSKEAKLYKAGVGTLLRGQFRGQHLPLFPKGVRVAIDIAWHRTARMGDLDKRLGVLLDALQGVGYANDAQLVDIHASLHESVSGDYVYVTLEARGGGVQLEIDADPRALGEHLEELAAGTLRVRPPRP